MSNSNPLAAMMQAQKELDELWAVVKRQGDPTEAQDEASTCCLPDQ